MSIDDIKNATEIIKTAFPGVCSLIVVVGTRLVVIVDSLIAILPGNTLHFRGNERSRFFSTDAFKFAFTAFTDALHRVFDTVRAVNTPAVRTPTQTRVNLVFTEHTVIFDIFRLDTHDAIVLHKDRQWTATATVD